MNNHTREIEAKIDAALAGYPLAPLPANFTAQVMARVTPRPLPKPEPRNRWLLNPFDLTLTIFFTTFFISILCSVWWTVGQINLDWLSRLYTPWPITNVGTLSDATWLTVLLAAAVCIEAGAAILGLLFWWDRSAKRSIVP